MITRRKSHFEAHFITGHFPLFLGGRTSQDVPDSALKEVLTIRMKKTQKGVLKKVQNNVEWIDWRKSICLNKTLFLSTTLQRQSAESCTSQIFHSKPSAFPPRKCQQKLQHQSITVHHFTNPCLTMRRCLTNPPFGASGKKAKRSVASRRWQRGNKNCPLSSVIPRCWLVFNRSSLCKIDKNLEHATPK